MTEPGDTHALYRFHDANGRLLYIGITLDPGHRWNSHRKTKPWWHDVTQVTVETHPSRAAVLEAERAAILAEKPLHNVVHNRDTSNGAILATPQLDRLAPIQAGDWIALGLADGRCPVGEVVALDGVWISVRLKEFLLGTLSNHIVAVRWSEVERVELAYPEDAVPDEDPPSRGGRLMDDEHLGEFQTNWKRARLGKDGRDPVDQARIDILHEHQEERRQLDRDIAAARRRWADKT